MYPTLFRIGHPTQLYESAALIPIAWLLLRWRRQHVPDVVIVGRYCILAGGLRFLIEFVRVNVRVVGPFTLAHLVSLALVCAGGALLLQARNTRVP